MDTRNLRMPGMILFDYGDTLLWEPEWNFLRGNEALLRYAVKNSRGLSAQEISRFADELFGTACRPVRAIDREIHEWQFLRSLYGLLQIEFSIPVEEQERVYYSAAIRVEPMPHIEELLVFLEMENIRKGVVSNLMSSGAQLEERLANCLPECKFEFIIASSEYGVRKPDPLIFQLACAKVDLPPEEIWFCGDNPRCDVEGAHAAGMFPIWHENLTVASIWRDPSHPVPTCPHLYIHDWRELIEILRNLPCTIPT